MTLKANAVGSARRCRNCRWISQRIASLERENDRLHNIIFVLRHDNTELRRINTEQRRAMLRQVPQPKEQPQ